MTSWSTTPTLDEYIRVFDGETPPKKDQYAERVYEPDWFERAEMAEKLRLLDLEESVDQDPDAKLSKSWWLYLGRPKDRPKPDPDAGKKPRPFYGKSYKLPRATVQAYLEKKYGSRLRKFA